MSSEWMKVMLEEITRKKVEAEHARVETERRAAELARVNDGATVRASRVGASGRQP